MPAMGVQLGLQPPRLAGRPLPGRIGARTPVSVPSVGHGMRARFPSFTGLHARVTPALRRPNPKCVQWVPLAPGQGTRLQAVEGHLGSFSGVPEAQGLFNPENDKDACGVGFVGQLSKIPSRKIVLDALEMLVRLKHRGACGCEENTGTFTHSPRPASRLASHRRLGNRLAQASKSKLGARALVCFFVF